MLNVRCIILLLLRDDGAQKHYDAACTRHNSCGLLGTIRYSVLKTKRERFVPKPCNIPIPPWLYILLNITIILVL